MTILGIDPGLTGAIAQINLRGQLAEVYDITASNGRIDVYEVLRHLRGMDNVIDMVVIEAVASMPRQGVASTFKFGRATGTLEGAFQALELPVTWITPSEWKAQLGLTGTKGMTDSQKKDLSRQWAQRRWPAYGTTFSQKAKGQARADAAGIAVAWLERHPEVARAG